MSQPGALIAGQPRGRRLRHWADQGRAAGGLRLSSKQGGVSLAQSDPAGLKVYCGIHCCAGAPVALAGTCQAFVVVAAVGPHPMVCCYGSKKQGNQGTQAAVWFFMAFLHLTACCSYRAGGYFTSRLMYMSHMWLSYLTHCGDDRHAGVGRWWATQTSFALAPLFDEHASANDRIQVS